MNLVERGVLTNHGYGVQRLLDRAEVEAYAGLVRPRDARQNLWLHHVVAGKIALDPAHSMSRARRNLGRVMLTQEGRTKRSARWAALLAEGPEALMRTMTAEGQEAEDLRQVSPVADLLSDAERRKALQAFSYTDRHSPDPAARALARRRVRRLRS